MLGRRLRFAHVRRSVLRRIRHPLMLLEIVAAPRAASVTFRVISLVVAPCSSTAVAITVEIWLILSITPLIPPIASTAPLVFSRITVIFA